VANSSVVFGSTFLHVHFAVPLAETDAAGMKTFNLILGARARPSLDEDRAPLSLNVGWSGSSASRFRLILCFFAMCFFFLIWFSLIPCTTLCLAGQHFTRLAFFDGLVEHSVGMEGGWGGFAGGQVECFAVLYWYF